MTPSFGGEISLQMALALGLLYGMGPCLVGCLPLLGPVYLGLGGGLARSWSVLWPVSLGRLSAYTGFGLAVGLAGGLASEAVSPKAISILAGLGTLLVGAALIPRPGKMTCKSGCEDVHSLLPGGLFLMGYSMALAPCGPLTAVLLAAAATGSATNGALLGLAFGVGAVAVPSLVLGIGVSYVTDRLREKLGQARKYAEWATACLLMANGLFTLIRVGIAS